MTPEQMEALEAKMKRWNIDINIHLNPFRWYLFIFIQEDNVTVCSILFLGITIVDTWNGRQ